MSEASLKKHGYEGDITQYRKCFRKWEGSRFNGVSALYASMYNAWSPDVRESQARAADGMPFNDNPTPQLSEEGELVESQNLIRNNVMTRVLGREHSVNFGTNFLILAGSEQSPLTMWPCTLTQTLMLEMDHLNYYNENNVEWTSVATVLSTDISASTFGSHFHTNLVNQGKIKYPQEQQWISTRGSIVDDVVSTKAQTKKMLSIGRKVVCARHGNSPTLGDCGPTSIFFIGTSFDEDMINIVDVFDNDSADAFGLYRIIIVNPFGFTQYMHDKLFGDSGVLRSKTPVRSFTNLRERGDEIEVIVIPVKPENFWGRFQYNAYDAGYRASFKDALKRNAPHNLKKRDKSLKKAVGAVLGLLENDEDEDDSDDEDEDEEEPDLSFGRNTTDKSVLVSLGPDTVAVRLYEVGSCTSVLCTFAGPAGYACPCGKGRYISHAKDATSMYQLPNEYFQVEDSDDDSEEDSDDDSEEDSDDDSEEDSDDDSDDENIRVRKTRCGACAACTRKDCGTCKHCKDKTKFGGPNKIRKPCLRRKCRRMSFEPKKRKVTSLNQAKKRFKIIK